jgi:hypothetical protein
MDDATLPMAHRKVEARIDGVLWETVIAKLPGGLTVALEASVQEVRPDADAIRAANRRPTQHAN